MILERPCYLDQDCRRVNSRSVGLVRKPRSYYTSSSRLTPQDRNGHYALLWNPASAADIMWILTTTRLSTIAHQHCRKPGAVMTNSPPEPVQPTPRRWWRSPIPWGVAASILVAFVPFLLNRHDTTLLLAILIALTGIVVTLLIDPLIGLHNLEERALLTLRNLLTALEMLDVPPSLLRFTKDLVHDWQSLETDAGEYRQTLLRAYAEEAKSRIHSIAQGKQERGSADPNNFRAAPLDIFRSLKALTSTNFEYWNQPHGLEYLERQRTAIATSGLEVERIFVLDDDVISDELKSLISRQLQIGITVRIIIRDDILHSLRRYAEHDFALAADNRKDKMLFKPFTTERESISFSPDDIAEYQHVYDELRRYSRDFREFLQQN
jgi:hypothetical protein